MYEISESQVDRMVCIAMAIAGLAHNDSAADSLSCEMWNLINEVRSQDEPTQKSQVTTWKVNGNEPPPERPLNWHENLHNLFN